MSATAPPIEPAFSANPAASKPRFVARFSSSCPRSMLLSTTQRNTELSPRVSSHAASAPIRTMFH
jgi:hypothetical protein